MYFIAKGSVEVVSEDGIQIFRRLSDGDFFGEIALLLHRLRTASVRAATHCDLFVLTRKDFNVVLKRFPSFRAEMKAMKNKYERENEMKK